MADGIVVGTEKQELYIQSIDVLLEKRKEIETKRKEFEELELILERDLRALSVRFMEEFGDAVFEARIKPRIEASIREKDGSLAWNDWKKQFGTGA